MKENNNIPKEQEDDNELVRRIAEQKYEFGFTTDVHTEIIPVGLNEDVVRLISAKKGEPEWMLDFRLRAFRYWQQQEEPKWLFHIMLTPQRRNQGNPEIPENLPPSTPNSRRPSTNSAFLSKSAWR